MQGGGVCYEAGPRVYGREGMGGSRTRKRMEGIEGSLCLRLSLKRFTITSSFSFSLYDIYYAIM